MTSEDIEKLAEGLTPDLFEVGTPERAEAVSDTADILRALVLQAYVEAVEAVEGYADKFVPPSEIAAKVQTRSHLLGAAGAVLALKNQLESVPVESAST